MKMNFIYRKNSENDINVKPSLSLRSPHLPGIQNSIIYGILCVILISSCCEAVIPALTIDHGLTKLSSEEYLDPPFPLSTSGHRLVSDELSQQEGKCSVCSHLNATLLSNKIPPHNNPYLSSKLTCEQFELYVFPTFPENSEVCPLVRDTLTNLCCDLTSFPSPAECKTNIRDHLLNDEDYDFSTIPLMRSETPGGQRLLEITVSLVPYITTNFDVKSSLAELFIGKELIWVDSRLKWNMSETFCDTHITVRASMDYEKTEIWVPDYDLRNRYNGFTSFSDTMATVDYNGRVTWYRNGVISALCTITGLSRIPYDTLGCQFIFSGVTAQDETKYILGGTNGTGYTLSGTSQNYNEYTLMTDNIVTKYFDAEEKLVEYLFYFKRAKRFYIEKILVPTIIFTYLSFGLFMINLRAGERLSYGMNVLLVIVAQDIVTADFLPVCDEDIWINQVLTASLFWVAFGVAESVLVLWLSLKYRPSNRKGKKKGENEDLSNEAYDSRSEEESSHKEIKTAEEKQKMTSFFQKMISTFIPLTEENKDEAISRLDTLFFYIFVVSYTIYLIYMFSNNKNLGKTDRLWGF